MPAQKRRLSFGRLTRGRPGKGGDNMEYIDYDLKKPKWIRARRRIIYGGERIRALEIWNDSIGDPKTVRVYFTEQKRK
jgi:hypothetical protein